MTRYDFQNTANMTTSVYVYWTGNTYYIVSNMKGSDGTQSKKDFTIDASGLTTQALSDIINNTGSKAYLSSISNSTLKQEAEDIKRLAKAKDNNIRLSAAEVSSNGTIISGEASDNYIITTLLNNPVTNYIKETITSITEEPVDTEIKITQSALASESKIPGIQVTNTIEKTGKIVNPFDHINNINNYSTKLQETIGGSDLSVFMLMENPDYNDIINGVPEEVQKKELLFLEMDNVLSLSYSTLREKYPVRVLGESNPRSYTYGSRSISGHIAFTVFVEDILAQLRGKLADQISETKDNFNKYIAVSKKAQLDSVEKYKEYAKYSAQMNNMFLKESKVRLLDQLPPFHILVMGMNESGVFSKMIIKNVTIVDENQYQGTQQPNIVNKVTFVAKDIVPMAKVNYSTTIVNSSVNSIGESYFNGKYSSDIYYNREVTGSSVLDEIYKDLSSLDKE